MAFGPWQGIRRELDRWADQGLRARFWLRDDDACEISAQLMRLYALAGRFNMNVGLAVIPGKIRPDFVHALADLKDRFEPMCHGWNHIDYGRPGHSEEFGDGRPYPVVRFDAEQAYRVFSECFGGSHVVFVPPFGRITPALADDLPGIGFAALSVGPDALERNILRLNAYLPWTPVVTIPTNWPIPRLNVHIDVIEWKRGTARDAGAVAADLVANLRLRRRGFLPSEYPIGLLTHHLVHDERIWGLCDELLDVVLDHDSAVALDAARLLPPVSVDVPGERSVRDIQSLESVSHSD